MGYEQICYALYDDPALLTERLQDVERRSTRRPRGCSVAAGCRRTVGLRRPGRQPRGFLKLKHFREYFLPYLAELVEYVEGLGVPGAAALLRALHRLPARPGRRRRSPRIHPLAAHRGDGPALGQGTLRGALLHHRQHRLVAHAALSARRKTSPPRCARPSTSPRRAAATCWPRTTRCTTASRSRTS